VNLVSLLTKWQTGPFSLAALTVVICLGVAYLVGVRRLASRGRRWSPLRTLSFLLGVLAVVVGLCSGVAYYSNRVFYVHAVQHVILMNGAAILFALGGPMTLWLQASGRPLQTRLLRLLNSKTFEIITFPVLVASVSYVVMIVYFLSPLYIFSEQHEPFLDFVNAGIIFSGCLYWWPVVGLDPSRWKLSFPAKLGYLATGIPVTTFLGLGLISTTTSIDPAIHTLADTHAGGGALWVLSELFTLGAMGAVLVQLMHSEEREAARYDRRMMHEEANLQREADLAAQRSAREASQLQ